MQNLITTKLILTKLILLRQIFVKNSQTEFHTNPPESFIIDTRAQRGGADGQKDVVSIQGALPSPRKEHITRCNM